MKVAGYIRVSTAEQANTGLGLAVQRDKIQSYCNSQSWELIQIYEDGGVSGATMDRPSFTRMLSDGKNGKYDLILTYKIDRISRSLKNLLILVEDTLAPMDIGLKSVTESFIDTSTPEGMAMFQVLGTFSELERKQITRKLTDARDKKHQDGGYAGGQIPYGYDVLHGKLVLNQVEAAIVKSIYTMRKEGSSLRKIAKALNDQGIQTKRGAIWRADGIRYILTNELYTGRIQYSGKVTMGGHESIVSRRLYNLVQV